MTESLNITILGAGSIGCYLGGCLVEAGCNVTLIGRVRMQSQLMEHGLTVTDWQGRNTFIDPSSLNYATDESDLSHADFILLTVKSGDTQSAAQVIAQHAKPTAIVVSLQNGVRNAQLLNELLPQHQIIAGMVPFNVLTKGNGVFHCGTEGNLAIEDNSGKTTPLTEAFAQANLLVDIYADLNRIQWSKLLMNLNNAINALSGLPLKDELSDRGYRQVLALAIKEALAALKAAGIKPVKTGKVIPQLIPFILSLPNGLFNIVAASMIKIDPTARSSMYEDFVLGRNTEVDYLNGEIVSLAKKYNTACPVNEHIMQLVKRAEYEQLGTPRLSAAQLLLNVNN